MLLFCGKDSSVNSVVNTDIVIEDSKFVILGYLPKGVFFPGVLPENDSLLTIYTWLRYVNFSDEIWTPTVQGGCIIQFDTLLAREYAQYCEIIGNDGIGYKCHDSIESYSNLTRHVSINYFNIESKLGDAWWFSWKIFRREDDGKLTSVREGEITENEIDDLLNIFRTRFFRKVQIVNSNLRFIEIDYK